MKNWILTSLLIFAPLTVSAHDYQEFAPLEPDLRAALLDVLSDAESAGALSVAQPVDNLAELLDTLDDTMRADLAQRLRHRAGVEDPARLPDNVILPIFYDLADFAAHTELHGSDSSQDGQAVADYKRLQNLLDRVEAK